MKIIIQIYVLEVSSWILCATIISLQMLMHGEVYLIQHYRIKFVSDLLQVSGVLWVLWFPPLIKLTATM